MPPPSNQRVSFAPAHGPSGSNGSLSTSRSAFGPDRPESTFDYYFYDPDDLTSSDPRRRSLARKSLMMQNKRKSVLAAANAEYAGGRKAQAASGPQPRDRRSMAFTNSTNGGGNRDSAAFGLGLGMLGGGDSDDDDDASSFVSEPTNDNDARRPPPSSSLHAPQDRDRPDSVLVRQIGSRPPDNVSQNPPSLKLAGLKSLGRGGGGGSPSPTGPAVTVDEPSPTRGPSGERGRNTSPFVDPPSYGSPPRGPRGFDEAGAGPRSPIGPHSPRTAALHSQLGLGSDANGSPRNGPYPPPSPGPPGTPASWNLPSPSAPQAIVPERPLGGGRGPPPSRLSPDSAARGREDNGEAPGGYPPRGPPGGPPGGPSRGPSDRPIRAPPPAALRIPPPGQNARPVNGPPSPYGPPSGGPPSPYAPPGGPGGPGGRGPYPGSPGGRPGGGPPGSPGGPGGPGSPMPERVPRPPKAAMLEPPCGPNGEKKSFSDSPGPTERARTNPNRASMFSLSGRPRNAWRKSVAWLTGKGGGGVPSPGMMVGGREPEEQRERGPGALRSGQEKEDDEFWRRFSIAGHVQEREAASDNRRNWLRTNMSKQKKLSIVGFIIGFVIVIVVVVVLSYHFTHETNTSDQAPGTIGGPKKAAGERRTDEDALLVAAQLPTPAPSVSSSSAGDSDSDRLAIERIVVAAAEPSIAARSLVSTRAGHRRRVPKTF